MSKRSGAVRGRFVKSWMRLARTLCGFIYCFEVRKNDAPLDFDLAKVIEQSQDNPVFCVQYCARTRPQRSKAGQGCFSRL